MFNVFQTLSILALELVSYRYNKLKKFFLTIYFNKILY